MTHAPTPSPTQAPSPTRRLDPRRALRGVALALLAAPALVAWPSPAPAADGDLVLIASFDRAAPKIGDAVQVQLTITNRTTAPTKVPELRLAKDSVSLGLAFDDGRQAKLVRHYGSFAEVEGKLEFRPTRTPRRILPAQGRVSGEVGFVAAAVGQLTVTPRVELGSGKSIVGAPLKLRIQPRGGRPKLLTARVETTRGSFRVELDGARSFNSVSHFMQLARSGFFDGLPFHRTLPGVLIQTGDPRGDGTGGPGWYLPPEHRPGSFTRGDVGLARGAHPESAGSQWFATLSDDPQHAATFQAGFTSLGRVADEDLPVLDTIGDAPTSEPVRVVRVHVVGR